MLRVNWQVWEFQIPFLAIILTSMVSADLLVQSKMGIVCRHLKRNLRDRRFGGFQQGIIIRETLARLSIHPISWGVIRVALLLAGLGALIVSVLTASYDRIAAFSLFYVGLIILGSLSNVFSLPRPSKLLSWQRIDFYTLAVYFMALTWFYFLYDSYILSWTVYGFELRDLFFVVLYSATLLSMTATFFLVEQKELYEVTSRFIYGRELVTDRQSIFRVAFTIIAYALLMRLGSLSAPSLAQSMDVSGMNMFQIIGGVTSLWIEYLSLWLPLAVSIVMLVLIVKWSHSRIQFQPTDIKEFFSWIVKEGSFQILFFAGGIFLLSTKGAMPSIPIESNTLFFIFVAVCAPVLVVIIFLCYCLTRTIRVNLTR